MIEGEEAERVPDPACLFVTFGRSLPPVSTPDLLASSQLLGDLCHPSAFSYLQPWYSFALPLMSSVNGSVAAGISDRLSMVLPTLYSVVQRGTLSCSRRRFSTFSCSVPSVSKKKDKVIVISGPTGVGKSRLAVELAKRLGGEIINADSVQVYRGLDVGSAKPSSLDRKDVPHHLLDMLHPSEEYSAGQFFEDARESTRNILKNGHIPIVAGGTGLYLRWYVYGKPDVPKASMDVTSEVCLELMDFQKNGQWDEAVDLVVKAGDPKVRLLPYNNWYRLRRSLEIIRSSGSPPSAFEVPYSSFKEHTKMTLPDSVSDAISDGNCLGKNPAEVLDYDFICIFLSGSRVGLYRSIDFRCEEMLMDTKGLLSEASWLLDIGLLPNMNSATRAIGYRQAMEYLLCCRQEGRSSPEEFHAFLYEFQKASRNFAKRQMTWFRNELIYHWLDASQPLENVVNFICGVYHDQTVNLVVPEPFKMKKEITNRRETIELKSYRSRNRLFVKDEDCYPILDWIRNTQQQHAEAIR